MQPTPLWKKALAILFPLLGLGLSAYYFKLRSLDAGPRGFGAYVDEAIAGAAKFLRTTPIENAIVRAEAYEGLRALNRARPTEALPDWLDKMQGAVADVKDRPGVRAVVDESGAILVQDTALLLRALADAGAPPEEVKGLTEALLTARRADGAFESRVPPDDQGAAAADGIMQALEAAGRRAPDPKLTEALEGAAATLEKATDHGPALLGLMSLPDAVLTPERLRAAEAHAAGLIADQLGPKPHPLMVGALDSKGLVITTSLAAIGLGRLYAKTKDARLKERIPAMMKDAVAYLYRCRVESGATEGAIRPVIDAAGPKAAPAPLSEELIEATGVALEALSAYATISRAGG